MEVDISLNKEAKQIFYHVFVFGRDTVLHFYYPAEHRKHGEPSPRDHHS